MINGGKPGTSHPPRAAGPSAAHLMGQEVDGPDSLSDSDPEKGTCPMYIEISGDGNTVAYPAQQPDWMAWTMLVVAVVGVIVPLL